MDKLVNISPEMKANATISDSYVKAIVSGDSIEAEIKFKPNFSFQPFARLISSTNELPRLLDLSDGFKRRLIHPEFQSGFFRALSKIRNSLKNLKRNFRGFLHGLLLGFKD